MYSGVFSCKVLAFAKSRVVAPAPGSRHADGSEEGRTGEKRYCGFLLITPPPTPRRRRRAATSHAALLRCARLALSYQVLHVLCCLWHMLGHLKLAMSSFYYCNATFRLSLSTFLPGQNIKGYARPDPELLIWPSERTSSERRAKWSSSAAVIEFFNVSFDFFRKM